MGEGSFLEDPLHRRAGPQRRGGFVPSFKNPPEVPLVQGGTLFSSNAEPTFLFFTAPGVVGQGEGQYWALTRAGVFLSTLELF